ncbi:calcium/sodium antiporter [Salmonella enterica subsp. enterica serovar Choleraesuis]|nr:calcium/sodium antiporter [Salmonella enterica subsp. enterica serovar Choleraesuis]
MLLATALLIIGLFLVAYGADRLVYASAVLCRSLGIAPLVIGMTVVSLGTSLPELILSVTGALHGQLNLAVGTALGSNIVNILLIVGLTAVLHPFTVHSDILRRELPLMLLVSASAGFLLFDGELSRQDGIMMLAMVVAYLWYMVSIARRADGRNDDTLTREQVAELPCDGSLPAAFLWLGLAIIIMPIATHMVLDNVAAVSNALGLSDRIMGLSAIAIGTSLPELATAVAGARKGEDDIAIGNIIGANIFNLTLVPGIAAVLAPGSLDKQVMSNDYWVMLAVSVMFALLCWRRPRCIGRRVGSSLLSGFILWMLALFITPTIFV